MPIIVDEVVITVEVTNPPPANATPTAPDAAALQTLVEACTERVLEILRQKDER